MSEQGTLPVIAEGVRGRILEAAERTIAAKNAANLLTDEHALTVETIRGMARAVDHGLQFGKVSIATTTMLRELREALASLPTDVGDSGSLEHAWAEFQKQVQA